MDIYGHNSVLYAPLFLIPYVLEECRYHESPNSPGEDTPWHAFGMKKHTSLARESTPDLILQVMLTTRLANVAERLRRLTCLIPGLLPHPRRLDLPAEQR